MRKPLWTFLVYKIDTFRLCSKSLHSFYVKFYLSVMGKSVKEWVKVTVYVLQENFNHYLNWSILANNIECRFSLGTL